MVKLCKECNTEIQFRRKDSIFCSEVCRNKNWQKLNRIKSEIVKQEEEQNV